MKTDRCKHQGT